jgi:branched-chain amino acid transport system substrate-binding protein
MSKKLIALAAAGAMFASTAMAETVKVGFVTTLSGPAGIIGQPMKDAFELALEHVGGKIGGLDTEIIYGDDQRKPDVAKQVVNKMIKRDRVQFIVGIIWSNVMMAIHKTVTRSDVFLISANAGPSPIAGKGCSENFFSVSWQNDQTPEAMGKYLQDKGINDVYLMAPNYQAGKDMLSGVRRYYKGNVVGQVFTKLGQKDYQAEISALRAANPKAVFVFLPGGMGINFVKQYTQAGLNGTIPLYTAFTVDAISLPALKDSALGVLGTQTWSPDLRNSVNRRFVDDFKMKYGKYPSFYSAQTYDAVMFLDHAIRKAGGVSDRDKLRAAMRAGDFPNTRGTLKFNNNHFPIQNFYIREAVKDENGDYTTKIKGVVFSAYGDNYAKECPMKW